MNFRTPRVFRHANYRLFFFGQLVSLMGTWMQAVALGWLVYRLTHSPFFLGVVSLAQQGPIFFLSPIGGAIADRHDRRRVFMTTQSLAMLFAATLTILTLTNTVTVGLVMALALATGIVTAIENPSRQSFTIEMVGREDLKQAIAFNAMMFNIARTIGPALGGVLVAVAGEGFCFLLNTMSYGAVLASLGLMRLERQKPKRESRPWDDLKTGFSYVAHHAEIRTALGLSALTGFFGMSFLALLPAYAREVLGQGSDALGFVMSGFGVGAFLGAAGASRLRENQLAYVPTLMAAALGVSLTLFASVHRLALAIAFVFPAGLSYLMLAVSNNTRMQTLSDDAMRGRVMSFYAMGALGCAPLGALLQGAIAARFGVPAALMLGGASCIAAAALSYASLRRQGILGRGGEIRK
jgi:MFS family permease